MQRQRIGLALIVIRPSQTALFFLSTSIAVPNVLPTIWNVFSLLVKSHHEFLKDENDLLARVMRARWWNRICPAFVLICCEEDFITPFQLRETISQKKQSSTISHSFGSTWRLL